jgi:hypothetical protein
MFLGLRKVACRICRAGPRRSDAPSDARLAEIYRHSPPTLHAAEKKWPDRGRLVREPTPMGWKHWVHPRGADWSSCPHERLTHRYADCDFRLSGRVRPHATPRSLPSRAGARCWALGWSIQPCFGGYNNWSGVVMRSATDQEIEDDRQNPIEFAPQHLPLQPLALVGVRRAPRHAVPQAGASVHQLRNWIFLSNRAANQCAIRVQESRATPRTTSRGGNTWNRNDSASRG